MTVVNITVEAENVVDLALSKVTGQDIVTVPSGWDELTAEYGFGYRYPLPTRTPTANSNDDANNETLYFGAAVRAANALKIHNTLADNLTLNNVNQFGNLNRLTGKTGTQTFGSYLIDHYTGLGWYLVLDSRTWQLALSITSSFSAEGFSDYMVANLNQLDSIRIYSSGFDCNIGYAPFNVAGSTLWSSTPISGGLGAMFIQFGLRTDDRNRTTDGQYLKCRRHY